MMVIGLTGGIGSGKSTVADCFLSLGVPVIDTDVIARQLVQPHEPAYEEICQQFGKACLQPDETLDRAYLREQIFADPAAKKWLENCLHPRIRAQVVKELANCDAPYAIVVIPLLIETAPNPLIDRILVVDATSEQQANRASQRDSHTTTNIDTIIAQQVSRDHRLQIADDVIDNTQTMAELIPQVESLHQQYLKLANNLS